MKTKRSHKRISRLPCILVLFLFAVTIFAQEKAHAQNGESAIPVIVAILLLDSLEKPVMEGFLEPITYSTSGSIPALQFANSGGAMLTSCNASPALPMGLTVRVSADLKTCEIVGTPSQAQANTTFTITAVNSRGSNTATVTLGITAGTIPLSGAITYDRVPATSTPIELDYTNIVQKPVRAATIELLNSAGAVLQTSVTDELGEFTFNLTQNELVKLRVRGELLSTVVPEYDVKVVDNTNSSALYTMAETSVSLVTGDGIRDLNAASGWGGSSYTGTRVAAPFAIIDSIYEAINDIIDVDPSVVFPPLVVNWSVNNSPTSPQDFATGAIGTSFYSEGNLYILGKANSDSDEFDDHIILHEWGHYFEDKLARSDSPGGDHGDGDRLDMRVAFGEGFGNALSGIITDDPIYVDTSGSNQASGFTIDVESNTWINPGWYSEGSVQSILYDLYDSAADGVDTVAMGLGPIYDVMVNEQKQSSVFTSIFSFISALKANNSAQASQISALVNGQSINGSTIDSTGSTETNDASQSNVLPVYTAIPVNGAAVNVCIDTQFNNGGDGNKLSNHRFFSFEITSNNFYFIYVTKTSSAYGVTDPEIKVFQNGVSIMRGGNSSEVDFEEAYDPLTPGSYVFTVSDYNVENSDARGEACFDVQITYAP